MLRPCAIVLVASLSLISGCASNSQTPSAGANPDAAAAKGTLAYDRGVFSEMLEKHERISRSVKEIEGGVETVTESDDPKVAALIVDHVEAMKHRVETGARLRQWDPLYVAVFDAGTKIKLEIEKTGKGVKVRETSDDPAVTALIRQHAGVVSGFAERGSEESAKAHPAPLVR
ncbi:MAG: hypothetical protein QM783_03540 [Phycisphaerales bacterium]